ncbi:MAG: glycosyltransferase family 4 protein [Clostridiales bacterium]|nr:glycosyltransferase family 4 protein [Clostridiales bacterium]
MKVLLITPSNIKLMPYVNNYKRYFEELAVEFDIVNWDRRKTEEVSSFKYADKKNGDSRNAFDYFRYSLFIKKVLKRNKYDKIIVFGIQLAAYLGSILTKDFNGKYIIDIRDYNRTIKYVDLTKVFNSSSFVTISSPGFREWLPSTNNFIVNHNFRHGYSSKESEGTIKRNQSSKINVSYIGTIRDLKQNMSLLSALKNSNDYLISYHGKSMLGEKLKSYANDNMISNVQFSGEYSSKDEEDLYRSAVLINILLGKSINSNTLMPNRIYSAAYFGKPIIALKGSYMASQIEKYNLGLTIDNFIDLNMNIKSYIESLDEDIYIKGRNQFLLDVRKDEVTFKRHLLSFLSSKDKYRYKSEDN